MCVFCVVRVHVCCLAGACEWVEMHGSIGRELFVHSRYMGYVCVGEISMSWEIAWCIYDIWKNIRKIGGWCLPSAKLTSSE